MFVTDPDTKISPYAIRARGTKRIKSLQNYYKYFELANILLNILPQTGCFCRNYKQIAEIKTVFLTFCIKIHNQIMQSANSVIKIKSLLTHRCREMQQSVRRHTIGNRESPPTCRLHIDSSECATNIFEKFER